MADRLFLLVSGPPASGKSTLALALARHLGLPLVAKGTIKEALMSVLEVADVEASKQLRIRDDLWNDENVEPIAGGWALVEVQTDRAVDVPAVVARIEAARG